MAYWDVSLELQVAILSLHRTSLPESKAKEERKKKK